MASVNFKKLTRQLLGALHVHMDTQSREEHTHANRHIDTSRTHLNTFIGAKDYTDIVRRVDERVRAVDAEHPPLRRVKDRVVACALEVPCPRPISDAGRTEEFMTSAFKLMCDFWGAENVCGGTVHRDEVHDYTDKDGQFKTSLEHGHFVAVPYAEWIDTKGRVRAGINGKHWLTREMLCGFNQAMNNMCLMEFGIEYNTHSLAEHKTVEELKRRTDALEEVRHDNELIDRHNKLIDNINILADRHNTLVDIVDNLEIGAIDLAQQILRQDQEKPIERSRYE